MSAWDDLTIAIDAFNATSLLQLETEWGLHYLGDHGPVFLAGMVRIRGAFVDSGEGYWADAHLVVESAYLGHPAYDFYADQPGGSMDPARDLWQFTPERGRHGAIIVPIDEICSRLDLPEPQPFPSGNWCRSWRTHPHVSDAAELGLVANGVPR